MGKIPLKEIKKIAIIVAIIGGFIGALDITTNWKCSWHKNKTQELTERIKEYQQQHIEDSLKIAQIERELKKANEKLARFGKSPIHLDSVSLNERDTYYLLSGKIEIYVSDIMIDKFGSYANLEINRYAEGDTTSDSYPRARTKDIIYFPFSETQYAIHILEIKHDPRPEKITIEIYEEHLK